MVIRLAPSKGMPPRARRIDVGCRTSSGKRMRPVLMGNGESYLDVR